jgi:ankyrin repeat protein
MLLRAIENGHEAVVKLLLEKSADLESKLSDDWTPLSLTVEDGYGVMVMMMMVKTFTTSS